LLVKVFGPDKAKRDRRNLMTNKIDDEGVVNKDDRGVRNHEIAEKARQLHQEQQDSGKNADNRLSNKRKTHYSMQGLFPDDILSMIQHKPIYQALQEENEDLLKEKFSPFVRTSLWYAFETFDDSQSKSVKKNIIRGHVYLDALVRLYRLRNQIEKPLASLKE